MKKLKKIDENEMVAVFLQTEINSPRYSKKILNILKKMNKNKKIIVKPDLRDKKENQSFRICFFKSSKRKNRKAGWLYRNNMNKSLSSLPKIPELNRRLMFAAFMLVVYRLGVFVPIPGVDSEQILNIFDQAQGTIFDMLNLFSGGALERASIFALGVMPYITSSIIMSLLVKAFPTLEAMQKEGEAGRRKINQYSRYGTILICLVQGGGQPTIIGFL